MKKVFAYILILSIFFGLANFAVAADEPVNLYFFYGNICPHCKKAEKFLQELKKKHSALEIHSYEVFGDKENAQLLIKFFRSCGKETTVRAPSIFIGEKAIIGYLSDETTGVKIKTAVEGCLSEGCQDLFEKINGEKYSIQEDAGDQIIDYPLIGKINLSKLSLPVLTIMIAALDGFNPCAMWVLLFLLALLINVHSRKKMFLIGGTFIIASGVIYYLLLSAWLNLFLAISYVSLIRIVIGVLALGAGIWQIRSFITFKPGVCKVAPLGGKLNEKLSKKASQIVHSTALPATFLGVVALAFGANLIEFFCSAGLPAVYTQILSLSHLNPLTYYLYLLLYTIIFMLDDMVVFGVAIITLSKLGFTDKFTKYSALIGGIIIFILGFLLIFRPDLLMFG